MQPLESSLALAKIRILLLIESANCPTPEHLQPRARVLRADQIRPDQIRPDQIRADQIRHDQILEVADQDNTISNAKAARAISNTQSSTRTATDSNGALGEDLGSEDYAVGEAVGEAVGDAVGEIASLSKSVGGALPPPEDVASSGCGDNMIALQDSLRHIHYEVRVLGSDLSPDALHAALAESLREENRPEVVILEASRDVSVVAARCYEVKNESLCGAASLLVVLPPAFLDSPNAPQTVAQLTAAGADDFLRCDAPYFEVRARLSLLASFSRLRQELLQTHGKMRNLLQTDDLTHLFSRRFFFQMAHREYERASRYGHDLSCLMIDVNYFRRITESMSFACGDAVLCHVAGVLRDVARDVDIVARFSDQKFVLLLPESDMEMADQIGDQIQHEIAQRTFLWQNKALPLSISIGEATWRGDAAARENLAKSARDDNEYSSSSATLEADETAPLDPLELDIEATPSLHEAIASLLEEADAALFVAKRGVRNNLMETSMASPLSP